MASNMANLLMQYGAELPNIIKSNRKTATDLETEKLRQALLQGQITESQLGSAFKQKQIDADDIANKSAVEEDQRKRQAREAMASALGSYASSKRTTGMAQDIAGMEKEAGLTPLSEQPGFEKPMTMREAAEGAGLPQYAEQPGVKEFYDQNVVEQEKNQAGRAPGVYGARLDAFRANPNAVPELISSIEAYHNSGKMKDDEYAYMMSRVKTDPVQASLNMDKFIVDPMTSAATVAAQTPEKVKQAYQMIAPETAKTTATTTAKETAPTRLPDKDVNELTGQQNVYNNLLDVKNKFDSKYLTPYVGKGIKMAFLKQNDPDFADFQSSLALALNEYRRANFGTAQTQSELNNFLDVINSDLNISPESFNKQLNVVVNAMQRDFNNKTKTKEQQNYMIPNNLKSIEIPKTITKLSPRDQEAVDWAKKNMSDPRAKKILQIHGM